jgi:dTDP-4-amino-4,6-dideoxygalactose transaminase
MTTWPHFAEDEIQAATDVLKSGKVNYWTGGECKAFEKEFAEFMGCQYGIALANGTLALELALWALGVGEGDEVITTPRTFVASASCIVMRGAIPVLADVDLDSQNITAETIEAVISSKTKAIIPVHLAGWPCEMDKIMTLADKHDLFVIEDCAQAHGAVYRGKPVGSWGDMAAFSFCQDKIMTTGGEGGMLVTNNKDLWKRAWALKDHGKSFDTVFNKEHPAGFRWLHEDFGTNWRMTEMQGAIGRKQLEKLPVWLEKRAHYSELYKQALSKFNFLRLPVVPEYSKHANYKYYFFVNLDMLDNEWTRDRIMSEINAAGVPCFSGSCSEIYLEKCFSKAGVGPAGRLPNAKELGKTSLMLLVHPTQTEEQVQNNIRIITAVLEGVAVKSFAL